LGRDGRLALLGAGDREPEPIVRKDDGHPGSVADFAGLRCDVGGLREERGLPGRVERVEQLAGLVPLCLGAATSGSRSGRVGWTESPCGVPEVGPSL
jgi:hypothetical protein